MRLFDSLIAQTQPSEFAQFVDRIARARLSHILYLVAALTVLHIVLAKYMSKFLPHERYGMYTVAKISREIIDAIVYAGVLVFMVVRPFAMQTFFIPSPSMVDTLRVNDLIAANKAIYRYTDPKAGDIVVFKPPKRGLLDPNVEQDYIKRLVGAPGQIIEIRDGELYRDGLKVNEPYVREPSATDFKLVKYTGSRKQWEGEYIPVTYMRGSPPGVANYGVPIASEYSVGMNSLSSAKQFEELTEEERTVMKELRDLPPAAIPPGYYLMMGDNRNNSFDSRGWGLVPRKNIIGRSEIIWMPISRWRITR